MEWIFLLEMNMRSDTARARSLARGETAHTNAEVTHMHKVYYQGINFTDQSQSNKYMKPHEREVTSTKWACPATITTLGIGNDFSLLCGNVFFCNTLTFRTRKPIVG